MTKINIKLKVKFIPSFVFGIINLVNCQVESRIYESYSNDYVVKAYAVMIMLLKPTILFFLIQFMLQVYGVMQAGKMDMIIMFGMIHVLEDSVYFHLIRKI